MKKLVKSLMVLFFISVIVFSFYGCDSNIQNQNKITLKIGYNDSMISANDCSLILNSIKNYVMVAKEQIVEEDISKTISDFMKFSKKNEGCIKVELCDNELTIIIGERANMLKEEVVFIPIS